MKKTNLVLIAFISLFAISCTNSAIEEQVEQVEQEIEAATENSTEESIKSTESVEEASTL